MKGKGILLNQRNSTLLEIKEIADNTFILKFGTFMTDPSCVKSSVSINRIILRADNNTTVERLDWDNIPLNKGE